ncbi:MAG: Helix-turn-helix-domain containing protein, AraC type [Candidatus Uhrbacteria bacterium GW2011_GWF2_39_13]|uniref:Helix-turn-helix-domain containing protein, AraC type n=1 Tax=Candidatus Uhrbacteria bacterium GW2011_GWF2_39_13 TaxID=1618995 RepID=A0A0G0Q1T6_9BACT|nr:MAG: Helix-turn-helix-domain containing protein, AraC type [Candidatus Uhrbacteria bacterium GW2011_GWF2_39_13]
MTEKKIYEKIIDVSKEKILAEYHNIVYRLTGIPMDFASSDGECFKLCPEHHLNPLCKLIRACPEGRKKCEIYDASALNEARIKQKSVIYTCHAGLTDIGVPIFINKKFIGCVTAGQILREKPSEKSFRKFKEMISDLNLNTSDSDLKKHFFKTPYLDQEKLQAIVDLISLVSNYIVDSQSKLLFFEKIHEKDKISVIRGYIEKKYKNKISIEDAASRIFLSASRFSHLFKKELGISFVQYLNKFRIEKAKDFLLNTNMSITEISTETGFSNLTHFNRIFKKLEKQSPVSFRKSRKGKQISRKGVV